MLVWSLDYDKPTGAQNGDRVGERIHMDKTTRTPITPVHGAILTGILTPHPTHQKGVLNVTPPPPPAPGARVEAMPLPDTMPPPPPVRSFNPFVIIAYGLVMMIGAVAGLMLIYNPALLVLLPISVLTWVGVNLFMGILGAVETWRFGESPCCLPSRDMMD